MSGSKIWTRTVLRLAVFSLLGTVCARTAQSATINLDATTTFYRRIGAQPADPNATLANVVGTGFARVNADQWYGWNNNISTLRQGTLTYTFQIAANFPYPYLAIQSRGDVWPLAPNSSIVGEYQANGGAWTAFFVNDPGVQTMTAERMCFLPVTMGQATTLNLRYTVTLAADDDGQHLRLFGTTATETFGFLVAGVNPIRLTRSSPVHTYCSYNGTTALQDPNVLPDPLNARAWNSPAPYGYRCPCASVARLPYLVLFDPGVKSLEIKSRVSHWTFESTSKVWLQRRFGLDSSQAVGTVREWKKDDGERYTDTVPLSGNPQGLMLDYRMSNKLAFGGNDWALQLHRSGTGDLFTWTLTAEYGSLATVIVLR